MGMPATGLAAYDMVSMVTGAGQLHLYTDPDCARAKARELHGLIFRLPIFEDYRDDPDILLPGWDSPATAAAELAEIDAILIDAHVTSRGIHGVAGIIGERDGLQDRVAELETALGDAMAHLTRLRQATQPPALLPDDDLPPIGRRALTAALSGPESLGLDPTPLFDDPRSERPSGFPLGRGVAMPEQLDDDPERGGRPLVPYAYANGSRP